MTPFNIMLVDDHPLIRTGMSQLIGLEPDLNIIAQASNGSEALELLKTIDPDLVLLDLNMKGMSGLETLKEIRGRGLTTRVVILTVSDSPADIENIMVAGADGYLLKDTEPDDILELLHQCKNGNPIFSKAVADYLAKSDSQQNVLQQLTEREEQILKLVAIGLRNKQIADKLFITESTVKVHMKSLFKKLNVSSRTAATVLYLEHQDGTI